MTAFVFFAAGLGMAYAIGWLGEKLWPPGPPCHCEPYLIPDVCPDCGRDPWDEAV